MTLRSLGSRLCVLLAGVVFSCSSCLALDSVPHPVSTQVPVHTPLLQTTERTVSTLTPSPHPRTLGLQSDRYGTLPLSFEANHGQTDPQVKFLSRGPGYALFLTATEAVLSLPSAADRKSQSTIQDDSQSLFASPTVVRMQVLDATPRPQIVGIEELPGKVNYLRGNDPALWHTAVPTYGKVQYHNVYPGIDLVYYGQQRLLEYDFIVAPGSTPSTIRLSFTDESGQPLPHTLDIQGNLILHTSTGNVHLHKPFVYQESNGIRTEVAGSYARHGTAVGFQIAAYDTSKPLVIDPKLIVYSTFLGGDQRDSAFALALDADNNVYVTGQTLSANFPLATGSFDEQIDNSDAFITKINDTGTAILYSTYLGGPGADIARAIAVDSSGQVYIAGETLAPDQLTPVFPTTTAAAQSTPGGGSSDAFVAKLDATGSTLLYSTYLGGAAADRANGLAIDRTGSAYIVGQTLSDFFLADSGNYTLLGGGPIAPNNDTTLPHDAFVVKLNPTGTARLYTAVFSARAYEEATAIAVNTNREAYVVGTTTSFDFPLTANTLRGKGGVDGTSDAFVVKLNAAGTTLLYSTYLGGVGEVILDPSGEVASAVAIDNAGHAVVAGITRAPDFPTTEGALETGLRGTQDGFLSIIDVNAIFDDEEERKPVYSTYLGGTSILQVKDLAVVGSGNLRTVFLAGTTQAGFPTSLCASQPLYGGGLSDAFIDKIFIDFDKPDNAGVAYATYLGGSEKEEAYGFAVDNDLNMYVAGLTQSLSFFTTADSAQSRFGGVEDAFITKFDTLSHAPCADLRLTMTDTPDPLTIGNTVTYSLTVTNLGPDVATNVTVTNILPSELTLLNVTPSTGACSGTTTLTCSLGMLSFSQTATITIVAQVNTAGSLINRASITASGPDPDETNNSVSVNTSVGGGHQLLVTVSNEDGVSGQIISRPAGIACPPDCTEAFLPGTTVNLIVKPDTATSSFRRWGGACTDAGTTPFCNLTVNGDLTVEASFTRATGLAAEWVGLTQTCRVSGKQQHPRCRVNGTLKVMNLGPVRATKFTTRFFFSDDPTLNSGYVVLKDKKVSGLAANSEQLIHVNLNLPKGVNGSGKFVVAYVDANAQVSEGDEANNRAIFGPLP